MASAHCIVNADNNIIGVAAAPGRDKVVVTVKGDGVSCYDINGKLPIRSWALGHGAVDLATPAVYDPVTQHYFVAVQDKNRDSTLFSWNDASKPGTTLHQAATHVSLPVAAAAVLSVGGAPPRQRRKDATAVAMEIDTSTSPAIFIAHKDGSVALCSTDAILSENTEATGNPLLAASVDNGALFTVHASRGRGNVSGIILGYFTVVAGKLHCEYLQHASSPSDGAHPIAATYTSGRAAVLWSDGSFAAYDGDLGTTRSLNNNDKNNKTPLAAAFVRRLRGFTLEAPVATPAGKTPGRRKRPAVDGITVSGNGGASLTAMGGGIVAVAGFTPGPPGSGMALRIIALDVTYGAVQCTQDLRAGDVGISRFDTEAPLQGIAVGGSGRIVLAAGGAALVLDIGVRPATLANLIGALSLPSQPQHGQREAAGPALAASAALHEDDLAQLVGPKGATAGALQYQIRQVDRSSAGDALVVEAPLVWELPGSKDMRAAEEAAWSQLIDAGSKKKGLAEDIFTGICTVLFAKAKKLRAAVSYDLLCKLLLAAIESKLWDGIALILNEQHPGSMAGCPGLASALATAHQYETLHALLLGATDISSSEIAALLRTLLTPHPQNSAATKARRLYAEGKRSVAAAALKTAEHAHAKEASNTGSLVATAACAAGTVDGFTAAQLCLHPLVAARHDGAVLLDALRQLSGVYALSMLRYLLRWLKNYRRIITDCHVMAADLPSLAVPGPNEVIEWASLTLDASMMRLAPRPEAAGLLAEVRAEVAPQLAGLRQLARVKGAVEHLQCGAPIPLPAQGAAGRYTMEWLSLRVA